MIFHNKLNKNDFLETRDGNRQNPEFAAPPTF